ncbi:AhpC/TSA antioxidant enzyme-domain-containing protein [Talaromyces proteolyticus]|uniref:AhpC/TSA antioxidant enzyme-domain-containing protein n=1 Tax=Talaromyces proteolyticus TaxID=1131652 RepID=A0AAD4L004_9EURO|nr:AhpC/TSA antioxidant enzyme-domain-containing protein [Talaromyces proteolyticus]KAH8700980.1 AhpC/TSA antioxidant enzyme-domain-containing protein [Talaromyces proteolyticus]
MLSLLNSPPTDEKLCEAYHLDLQSPDGSSIKFGELVAGKGDCITTVVIFIRHFFCAYDQDYVRALSRHVTNTFLSNLPAPAGPTQLIVIGCGDHSLIVPYMDETTDAFPIYTDRSGTIYETLSMKRTLAGMVRPPEYTKRSYLLSLFQALKQMFRSGPSRAFKGGSWNQNGGEWIFKGGKLQYVHRMTHVSDHLSAGELLKIIQLDETQIGMMQGNIRKY